MYLKILQVLVLVKQYFHCGLFFGSLVSHCIHLPAMRFLFSVYVMHLCVSMCVTTHVCRCMCT